MSPLVAGVFFTDLKPENVLLKNDPQSPIGVVGKVCVCVHKRVRWSPLVWSPANECRLCTASLKPVAIHALCAGDGFWTECYSQPR